MGSTEGRGAKGSHRAQRRSRRNRGHSRSRGRRRLALAVPLVAAILGTAAMGAGQIGAAAPGGWYVATVPGTGADDVLLGTDCANALECWAVGVSLTDISGPNSLFAPIVERWNGTSWSLQPQPPLPSGEGGGFFDVSCVSGSDCWAVGTVINETSGNGNPEGTLIEHWDGGAWTMVPSPNPTTAGTSGAILQSVACTSSADCLAVGYSTTQGGGGLNRGQLIEQWNGTSWSIVPAAASGQPFDMLTRVDCLSASDCWAVGNAGPAPQNPNFLPIFPNALGDQGLIEHWDGAAWSVVPSVSEPSPNGGYLAGFACTGPSDCWASGSTTDGTGMAAGLLLEHWNGTSWSDTSGSVPDPMPGVGAIMSNIACVGPAQCWAVGSTGPFGGGGGNNFKPQAFVENWNGLSWSIAPSPEVAALSLLNDVTCLPAVGCLAGGTSAVGLGNNNNDPGLRAFVEQMSFPPASSQGIMLAAHDGGVFNYGTAPFLGSLGGQRLNAPVVGVAATPDGGGYWLVGSDGGVFAYGDARFFGSMGGQHVNAPVVGMAATPDGRGYWLVASDGGVFTYGDARFAGSMGGQALHAPVVAMASAGNGGYWLVGSDGGVFSFGGAAFEGSAGAQSLARPVTGMAATPDGAGYWLVGNDGGVFSYGDAPYFGSVPGQGITGQPPVVGICRTPTGAGYWLVGSNGAVYTYGDAAFLGAPDGRALAAPVTGIASP
jgi:hypothetical protein